MHRKDSKFEEKSLKKQNNCERLSTLKTTNDILCTTKSHPQTGGIEAKLIDFNTFFVCHQTNNKVKQLLSIHL